MEDGDAIWIATAVPVAVIPNIAQRIPSDQLTHITSRQQLSMDTRCPFPSSPSSLADQSSPLTVTKTLTTGHTPSLADNVPDPPMEDEDTVMAEPTYHEQSAEMVNADQESAMLVPPSLPSTFPLSSSDNPRLFFRLS